MSKEIAFPEFIGETEQAVVLVVPSLDDVLSVIYARFHEGEEIDYWYNWELSSLTEGEYMVILEIGWEGEKVVSIGFTLEMWEYLPVITRRVNVVLMTDWKLIEEGIAAGMDQMGRFRPRALLVRDAGRGMTGLSEKVAKEAVFRGEKSELVKLLSILHENMVQGAVLH
ncbi:MAG: hypothetical protein ACYC38_08495 [Eubacteriales bacterium]